MQHHQDAASTTTAESFAGKYWEHHATRAQQMAVTREAADEQLVGNRDAGDDPRA